MSNRRTETTDWGALLQDARDSFSLEILGLVIFLLGGVALLSLRSNEITPWLVRMAGWTAPLIGLVLIILGLVLMFRRRAGYWSAEALVGAELLLLALMVITFLGQAEEAAPTSGQIGRHGGLIGSVIGSMTMSVLGRWPAYFLFLGLVLIGCYLLVRYTPLIYGAAYLGRLFPALPALWAVVTEPFSRRHLPATDDDDDGIWALPQTANFIPAIDDDDAARGVGDDEYDSRERQTAGRSQAAKRSTAGRNAQPAAKPVAKSPANAKPTRTKPMRQPDELPPTDMLAQDAGDYEGADVELLRNLIETTLADFNVPVRVVHVESGPTVTQFGVEPLYLERAGQKRKVRVNRIVALGDDLALALAAPAVRIEAPVPGRPYVGIEVPNPDKTLVSLRGILESPEMRKAGGELVLPLGRDTAGRPVVMDLTRAPHMLIAGQTGSGKSVCINTIITGLLMQHGPESLRFVMVDPKMVELPGYNGIPHLMGKVITDMDQVMGALTWLLIQMDDRYRLFREAGVRNVDSYNALARRRKSMEHLPYIVLIVDELADLMMTAAEDIERQICRLAQMARATGIHLILATQRPSTDVVTGLIKANFPTRTAFAVTSQIDSRVILDTPGAERLLGRGDMLLMRPDSPKLFRIQGCWVADAEIESIVRFWKEQESIDGGLPVIPPWNSLLDRMDDEDELIHEAMDVIRGLETCSASMLQRKLRIGYPKAARLIEDLEKRGAVGPDLGGGQGRPVLLKAESDDEDDEEALL